MCPRIAAFLPLCALLALPANGQQTFPYTAHIAADDVYIRSGPGKNYYPTSKLEMGEKVEIYRHDPGGWYAVRPVEGSFSWVSGRYLQPDNDGLATATGDRIAARVGSEFSDIRDVIQVRLHRGEVVEMLGEKQFGDEPDSGTWYKIAPPAGEFRWVFGRFVDSDYRHSGVRKAPDGNSPLLDPDRPPAEALATTPSLQSTPTTQSPGTLVQAKVDPTVPQEDNPSIGQSPEVRVAQRWSPPVETDEPSVVSSANAVATALEAEDPVRHTNKFVEPAHDPAGTPTLRRISPDEFQAELDDVDMALSIMLAEELTVWKFDELVIRAQALMTEAETAVERGRARLLTNKIAQSNDIKQRYDAVNEVRAASERQNRQLAQLEQSRGEPTGPGSSHRFDGTGRLARVAPSKVGTPRYALVDEKGKVSCYLSPAPGVNMNHYLGKHVGVNGILGQIPQYRAQHVAVKHVTALDSRRSLR